MSIDLQDFSKLLLRAIEIKDSLSRLSKILDDPNSFTDTNPSLHIGRLCIDIPPAPMKVLLLKELEVLANRIKEIDLEKFVRGQLSWVVPYKAPKTFEQNLEVASRE